MGKKRSYSSSHDVTVPGNLISLIACARRQAKNKSTNSSDLGKLIDCARPQTNRDLKQLFSCTQLSQGGSSSE